MSVVLSVCKYMSTCRIILAQTADANLKQTSFLKKKEKQEEEEEKKKKKKKKKKKERRRLHL